MRSGVLFFIGVIVIVLNISIYSNIIARTSYSDNLRFSIDEALERTMHLVRRDADDHFQIVSNGNGLNSGDIYEGGRDPEFADFKNDFVKAFCQNFTAKTTNLTFKFYGVDEANGLMSVEIVADFEYLPGKTATVSTYKTMVLNRHVKEVQIY